MIRYLKNMEKEITIGNDLSEIGEISQFMEEVGLSLQLPSDITMSTSIAVEEAMRNIICYGYPAGQKDEISLNINSKPGELSFHITDGGLSFDPSFTETSSEPLSLDRILTNGLGLFVLHRAMDMVIYHSGCGKNHLTLTKMIDISALSKTNIKTNFCKFENIIVLTLDGRLDTANTRRFETLLPLLLSDEVPEIIINCENLTYVSSSALRIFVVLQKNTTMKRGHLILEAMRPEIRKIFDMTGCSSVFTIR